MLFPSSQLLTHYDLGSPQSSSESGEGAPLTQIIAFLVLHFGVLLDGKVRLLKHIHSYLISNTMRL